MPFLVTALKNKTAVLSNIPSVIYTCPSSRAAKVTHLQVTNTGIAPTVVTLCVHDASEARTVYFAKDVYIPEGATFKALGDNSGLWLEAGDYIEAWGASADLLLSVIEYSLPD